MYLLIDLFTEVRSLEDPQRARIMQRFFKTGVGQYGYGDIFLGLSVPQSRIIAKKYQHLSLPDVAKLLQTGVHEERLIALVILAMQYKKGDPVEKNKIFDLYLANTKFINNWDLVDMSAEYIVGEHLRVARLRHSGKRSASGISKGKPELGDSGLRQNDGIEIMRSFAKSNNLWERRIAIIATFAWIKQGVSGPTFAIADILMQDKEDLIHKAVGWMLREVGKRVSQEEEEQFLKTRYRTMPRTMLRYAIEHFEENLRKAYLTGTI